MHHPSYTSVESPVVSENFSNYRTKGQELGKKERRPQASPGLDFLVPGFDSFILVGSRAVSSSSSTVTPNYCQFPE
jgi:hypothetical protein